MRRRQPQPRRSPLLSDPHRPPRSLCSWRGTTLRNSPWMCSSRYGVNSRGGSLSVRLTKIHHAILPVLSPQLPEPPCRAGEDHSSCSEPECCCPWCLPGHVQHWRRSPATERLDNLAGLRVGASADPERPPLQGLARLTGAQSAAGQPLHCKGGALPAHTATSAWPHRLPAACLHSMHPTVDSNCHGSQAHCGMACCRSVKLLRCCINSLKSQTLKSARV